MAAIVKLVKGAAFNSCHLFFKTVPVVWNEAVHITAGPYLLLSFVAQKNQTCQATMQKHAKTKKHYNRKLIPPFIDGATALPETRPHVVLECLGTVFAALWTTLGTFNPCASHLIQWKG